LNQFDKNHPKSIIFIVHVEHLKTELLFSHHRVTVEIFNRPILKLPNTLIDFLKSCRHLKEFSQKKAR